MLAKKKKKKKKKKKPFGYRIYPKYSDRHAWAKPGKTKMKRGVWSLLHCLLLIQKII